MRYCAVILFLTLFNVISIVGQDQRGFINIPDATRNRVRVLLECGPQMMNVKMFFNRTIFRQFSDWIVVGLNNRIECRQQGNGDLQYVIEIPLTTEPCGTKMVESGTFENTISIKKHPLLILEGDEVITVRCAYSPPGIGPAQVPSVSNFQGVEFPPPVPPVPTVLFPVTSPPTAPATANMGTIYIIIFLVLFLLLLCLLCCCVCFLARRRKKRMEKRKKIFLSVPQSSELTKLGIGHLWWTGKASCSNDALLSHDYMVSTNSTREHLSVSTEYPNDTTPTNSSSSPNDGAFSNQSYLRDVPHLIPRAHIDTATIAKTKEPTTYVAEEQRRSHFKNPSTGRNLRISENFKYRSDLGPTINASSIYAQVNTNAKTMQDTTVISNQSAIRSGNYDKSLVTEFTEVKPTTLRAIGDGALNDGTQVSSTSERTVQSALPTTLVTADIHINNNGTLFVSHDGLKSLHQSQTKREEMAESTKVNLDVIIRAIEHNKGNGNGAKDFSEADLRNLANLVENSDSVREIILHAKSVDDFEAISHLPHYENLYTQEKWAIIVRSLAQVGFMQQLSGADENNRPSAHSPSLTPPNSHSVSVSPKGDSDESFGISDNETMTPERRMFTRESYYQVKSNVESSSSDNTNADADHSRSLHLHNIPIHSRKDISERSSSEIMERAPVLNVYLGNVPNRAINVQYKTNGNGNGNGNGYYYREATGSNWDDSSIYSTVNTQTPGNTNTNWQSTSHKM